MADGSVSKNQERADRILDAAAELVLRWGYKRVTIEEVAKRAGIGKGTIYLHWKTREALFIAVMTRDGLKLYDAIIAAMREDPAEILLHRMVRRTFLLLKDHPLLLAALSRDTEVLGDLVGEARPLQSQKSAFSHDYLDVLRSHGFLRSDMTLDAQYYACNATVIGFFLADPLLPPETKLPLDEKAEVVARTIRNAFEPPDPPDPEALRALAPTIIARFERIRAYYAKFAQGGPTATRESPQE